MGETLAFLADVIAVTPAREGFAGTFAIADSAVMTHREGVRFRVT
jgi:hypothetical protein